MLFILQFISNKTKVLTFFGDESYHNTSIQHINKKKYNTSLQRTYKKPHSKAGIHLFTIHVYMPTEQFADVQNTSTIFNNRCV